MLHATTLCGFGGNAQSQHPTLIEVLTSLGLTTNLELCLDAGDSLSYVSGQKWLDRSGNGADFFLGADVNASTDDPTFTGIPGHTSPSAYFSFDGGDVFTYDTTNETWMQNLHKNNAIFTVVAFYYQDGAGDEMTFCGGGAIADIGINFDTSAGSPRQPQLRVGPGVLAVVADTALGSGAWHMVGLSLNEATGAGGGFFYSDGAYNQVSASDTFTSTYTSPSSSDMTHTFQVGASGNGPSVNPTTDGQRLSCIAIWEGTALSKANMDSIWAAMRGRFGL